MAKMVALVLKKHYKSNFAGEVCGFPEEEAAHIIKHGGGELYKGEVRADEVRAPGDAPIEQPAAATEPEAKTGFFGGKKKS